MSTYKITNITNLAGKRDFKFNTELSIDFVDNMVKKTIKVKPNDSVFLSVKSLPLSVHRLRVKGLITVSEIGETELAKTISANKPVQKPKILKSSKPKSIKVEEVVKTDEPEDSTKAYGKKKAVKKEVVE